MDSAARRLERVLFGVIIPLVFLISITFIDNDFLIKECENGICNNFGFISLLLKSNTKSSRKNMSFESKEITHPEYERAHQLIRYETKSENWELKILGEKLNKSRRVIQRWR